MSKFFGVWQRQFRDVTRAITLVAGMALVLSHNAQAQESKQQLPNDGWWVTYSWHHTTHARTGAVTYEYTKKHTISFVETLMQDAEICRWIEFKDVRLTDGQEAISIIKLLISEKDLLESEGPLKSHKRGWSKYKSNAPQAFKYGDNYYTSNFLFPGMWTKIEPEDNKRVVDFQRGHLTIPESKQRQVDFREWTRDLSGGRQLKWKEVVDYTTWFEQTTFPLVSAARIQTKTTLNGDLTWSGNDDIELQDCGTGAQTELPENN